MLKVLVGILILSNFDGIHGRSKLRYAQNKPHKKISTHSKQHTNVPSNSPGRVRKWATLDGKPTLLMAHRGEKILQPENTIGAYEFATVENADYVEPDLVMTKDGHFVCYHELTIKSHTDVSKRPEFADRMKSYEGIIDEGSRPVHIKDDWFISDFTLSELKTIKLLQKEIGIRPQRFNGFYSIPTFEEFLETIHHQAYALNRSIGIAPEPKHPGFHNQMWASQGERFMEDLLLSTLSEWGYPLTSASVPNCSSPLDGYEKIPCGPVIIQDFEVSSLKYLASKSDIERYILIDIQFRLLTYEGLKEVATYAHHYSVWKELLYTGILAQIEAEGLEYNQTEIKLAGGFIPAEKIVQEAHAVGLKVGIYTIYDSREPSHRGCTIKCDPENKETELFYYFDMGVDSFFVENVAEAREIRSKYEYSSHVRDPNPRFRGNKSAINQGNSYKTYYWK